MIDHAGRDPRERPFLPARPTEAAFACALCGLRFTHGGKVCASCPITHGCDDLVRCPRCGYQFPRGSHLVAWLQSLLARLRRGKPGGSTHPVQTLDRLRPGETGRVLTVDAADPRMLMKLSHLGLVPGAQVVLQQTRPATVVRIGETTVALQRVVAAAIHVRRDPDAFLPVRPK